MKKKRVKFEVGNTDAESQTQIGETQTMADKRQIENDIAPAIAKELHKKNPMAIPKVEKIVVNRDLRRLSNAKILDTAAEELNRYRDKKPLITKAKKNQSRLSNCVRE